MCSKAFGYDVTESQPSDPTDTPIPCFPPLLPEIISAKTRKSKLIWLLILTVLSIGFIYSFTAFVTHLLSNPEATQLEILYKEELQLPDIAICSTQPLDIAKLLRAGYTVSDIAALYRHFVSDVLSPSDTDFNFTEVDERLLRSSSWDEFVRRFGPQCESLFLTCFENWKPVDCCTRVQRVLHGQLGNCFVIRNSTQTQAGSQSGLVLTLSMPKQNSNLLAKIQAWLQAQLPLMNGLIMEVAVAYNPPRSLHARHQILLSPGQISFVSMKASTYVWDNSHHHPCRHTHTPQENSKLLCKQAVHNEVVERVCNCSLLGFSDSMHLPICAPWQLPKCADGMKNLSQWQANRVAEQCAEPCWQALYDWKLSSADLSPLEIGGAVKHSTQKISETDYYRIHIYYPTLTLTTFQERSVINFGTAAMDFGNVLSLYLGATLTHLIRFCAFIVLIVANYFRMKKRHPLAE